MHHAVEFVLSLVCEELYDSFVEDIWQLALVKKFGPDWSSLFDGLFGINRASSHQDYEDSKWEIFREANDLMFQGKFNLDIKSANNLTYEW